MKVKEVMRRMEEAGWVQVRMRGDHRILKKEGVAHIVVVPGALSDDLPTGTLKSILRGAGL